MYKRPRRTHVRRRVLAEGAVSGIFAGEGRDRASYEELTGLAETRLAQYILN